MFENQMNTFQNAYLTDRRGSQNLYALQYNTALNQFRAAVFKGKLSRLKRRMLGRPQQLYDLNALKQGLSLRGSSYAGIQVVPISSIIGSEGRSADFDMDFRPISETARERWVNMAIAYLARIILPPIQLIQVGDAYFVRDGHHRISVSRAFGQVAMDAEVITWKATPPFPWQSCCADNPNLLKSPHLSA
jgi:hypothetical protein